jgi:YfaZ precursor
MKRFNVLKCSMRELRKRACLGLIPVVLALMPWPAHADDQWTDGRGFGLQESTNGSGAPPVVGEQVVAALSPGSVVIAQAGAAPAQGKDWQVTVAPYFWMARTKMNLDVGQFSRSTTIDFVDVVPDLHGAFAAHAEATWREWTGFLDLFYISMGQSEPKAGVSVSTNIQELFFEFGATYRLPALSLGGAGSLTFEPLAGGRFMWVDVSLGFPNQKVSTSGSVIDPMIGGRIVWRITDTVSVWFRGDVAGFGISDSQSNLTYNLLGGVEWRFVPRASALVGFRYLNIDLEKNDRRQTFNADIEMFGPFIGVNFYF